MLNFSITGSGNIFLFSPIVLFAVREGLSKHFCIMEKEDLKILNKGGEEEMVWLFYATSVPNSATTFKLLV